MHESATIQRKALGGGLLVAMLIAAVCAFAGLATPAWAAGTTSWSSVVSELNSTGAYTLDPTQIDETGVNAPLAIEEGKTATLTLTGNLDLNKQPITVAAGASLTLTAGTGYDATTQPTLSGMSDITLTPGSRADQRGAVLETAGEIKLDISGLSQLTIPCGTEAVGTGCRFAITGYCSADLGACDIVVQAQGTNAPAALAILLTYDGVPGAGGMHEDLDALAGSGTITVQAGGDDAHNALLDIEGYEFGYGLHWSLMGIPAIVTAGKTTIDWAYIDGLTVNGGTTDFLSGEYGNVDGTQPLIVNGGKLTIGSLIDQGTDMAWPLIEPVFLGQTFVNEVNGGMVEVISGRIAFEDAEDIPTAEEILKNCTLGPTTVFCKVTSHTDFTSYTAFPSRDVLQEDIDVTAEGLSANPTPSYSYTILDGPVGTIITRPAGINVTSETPNVTVVNPGETPPGTASDVQASVAAAKSGIVSSMVDYAKVSTTSDNATWTIAVTDEATPLSEVSADLLAPFVASLVESQALTAASVQDAGVTLSLPGATAEQQADFCDGVLSKAVPMAETALVADQTIAELVGKTCGINVACRDGSTLTYAFNFVDGNAPTPENLVPVYRMFNYISGEHLYTTQLSEVYALLNGTWNFESVKWYAPEDGLAVYRLFNIYDGEHLYTADTNEKDVLLANGQWTIDFGGAPDFYAYADQAEGTTAVTRLFNSAEPAVGSHMWTLDQHEVYVLTTERGWSDEGVKFYEVDPLSVQ